MHLTRPPQRKWAKITSVGPISSCPRIPQSGEGGRAARWAALWPPSGGPSGRLGRPFGPPFSPPLFLKGGPRRPGRPGGPVRAVVVIIRQTVQRGRGPACDKVGAICAPEQNGALKPRQLALPLHPAPMGQIPSASPPMVRALRLSLTAKVDCTSGQAARPRERVFSIHPCRPAGPLAMAMASILSQHAAHWR